MRPFSFNTGRLTVHYLNGSRMDETATCMLTCSETRTTYYDHVPLWISTVVTGCTEASLLRLAALTAMRKISPIMELTASTASRKSCIAMASCVTRFQRAQKVAISAGTMQAITSRRLLATQGQHCWAAFHAELSWSSGSLAAIAAALAGTQATAASDTG